MTRFIRFRLSSHYLMIERGRSDNTPRDERICKCCNMSMIKREYHCLLACPLVADIRRKFFKPYFCRWPNLNNLMSNSKQILIVAKYITHKN